jgi:hypothetical protein
MLFGDLISMYFGAVPAKGLMALEDILGQKEMERH